MWAVGEQLVPFHTLLVTGENHAAAHISPILCVHAEDKISYIAFLINQHGISLDICNSVHVSNINKNLITALVIVFSIAGSTTLAITGHLGGKIVYQHEQLTSQSGGTGDQDGDQD